MPERDGKNQGEGSPKQACSYWFVRHYWLVIMAQIPIPWREVFPPPSSMSLTLPVPVFLGGVGVCFLMFCLSLVVSPNSLNQARFQHMSSPTMCLVFLFPFLIFIFLLFPSTSIDDMGATSGVFFLWIFLLLSLFPNGFLLCDHGLDLWDRLMCEFNQSIKSRDCEPMDQWKCFICLRTY